VLGECDAAVNTTSTTGCPDHGAALVAQAAGLTGNYWEGGDAVPVFSHGPADSWRLVGPTGDNPFMSGIFYRPGGTHGSATSYFEGLNQGWLTVGDAIGNSALGMGVETAGQFAGITDVTEWVDQVVITYVESFADTDNDGNPDGPTTLVQNFRQAFHQIDDQNTTQPTAGRGADTQPFVDNFTDFRLEQMVELGQAQFEASRQTLQQAFADTGETGGLNDGGFPANAVGDENTWGQLISQDVEGFFLSCVNCDNGQTSIDDHIFTPAVLDIVYNPYIGGWSTVPTITHGGSGN